MELTINMSPMLNRYDLACAELLAESANAESRCFVNKETYSVAERVSECALELRNSID